MKVAERIRDFIPSLEMVRFLNSGSEACAITARLARAFTGRPLVAMCEGNHHGQLDTLLFSHYGAPTGEAQSPDTVCDSLGMVEGIERSVIALPFNDAEAATAIVEHHAERLAAVFIEPIMIFGGAIPAESSFVQALRQVTERHDILLVADEVPAGVRIGRGGAMGFLGVEPDLFITGKALAGGLPVGLYGGRRDILEPLLSPPHNRQTRILSSGTFSGNPTVLSACLAVLDALQSGEVHQQINALGEHARQELRMLVRSLGVPVQVTGTHSIFGLHYAERFPRSARDIQHDQRDGDFSLAMMVNGVLWPPGRIAGFICTAHNEQHIEQLVRAARIAIEAAYCGLIETSSPATAPDADRGEFTK